MQAASLLDGLSFDGFSPFEYGRSSSEVDTSRRQVVQAPQPKKQVGESNFCPVGDDDAARLSNCT